MTTTTLEISFAALDSLYFRGSRPHAAAGGSALPSEFPPPVTTMVGSIRTRLGDALGVDWGALRQGKFAHDGPELPGVDAARLMGSAEDTGLLEFGIPRIRHNGKRLYAVPAVLMKAGGKVIRLRLGDAVTTDLGRIRLPVLPEGVQNAEPLEDCWLTGQGMTRFLEGEVPRLDDIVERKQLVSYEHRLGIGRNVAQATVEKGLLYQTQHLRLCSDVDFAIRVTLPQAAAGLLHESIETNPLQRFGGEGRMVSLAAAVASNETDLPAAPKRANMLVLLADMLPAADFANNPLPGLESSEHNGVRCWHGELAGERITLTGVVCGKPRRYGGWDIRHNRPRSVQSYIPAGGCFHVQTIDGHALPRLHGRQAGRRTDCGFGTLVCAA